MICDMYVICHDFFGYFFLPFLTLRSLDTRRAYSFIPTRLITIRKQSKRYWLFDEEQKKWKIVMIKGDVSAMR